MPTGERLAGIILAAGFGKRMRSRTPKVMFSLLGRALLDYPLSLLESIGAKPIVVVVGSGADEVRAGFAGRSVRWALQDPPRGTGDAARIGLGALRPDSAEAVVILNGDLPLVSAETLLEMTALHRKERAALTLLILERDDPTGYGRIIRDAHGAIAAIVEEADASAEERRRREVNGGVYVAAPGTLADALETLAREAPPNRQDELYLPPVIGPLARGGGRILGWELPKERAWEIQQVNTRAELAAAAATRRDAILAVFQDSGVTIVDPATTYIEEGVEIGRDTVIYPFTVIERGVRIGERCRIGPFAHLRVGSVLEEESEIGNFTEVKNSRLGKGSKAKHLSYLGDLDTGAGVNIGAGTIIANYDGTKKHRTLIGDGAFLGSGTILVAPVEVGSGARTGAGAVVPAAQNVPAGETVVGVPARRHPSRRAREVPGESSDRAGGTRGPTVPDPE